MLAIKLDYFLPPIEDQELNQYKILATLKEFAAEFHKSKLYPALAQLNQIDYMLNSLLTKHISKPVSIPRKIETPAADTAKVNFLNGISDSKEALDALDLIKWAKPKIESTIAEAIAIYDFVYENVYIESIKPEPAYRDEGYFVVPDYKNSQLLMIEYLISFFDSNNEPARSLKTKLINQITLENIHTSITETALKMVNKYDTLVNPAIFVCKTVLDFPFWETLYPIAKSKLLSILTTPENKYLYT